MYKDDNEWHRWVDDERVAHLLWQSRAKIGYARFDPIVSTTLKSVRVDSAPPNVVNKKNVDFDLYFVSRLLGAAQSEELIPRRSYAAIITREAISLGILQPNN